jgi:predicted choloylglycine hydrolase
MPLGEVSTVKVLQLEGNHYQMGLQHGQQVLEYRPSVVAALDARLEQLEHRGDADELVEEVERAWAGMAGPTLDMLRGIAEALRLPQPRVLKYLVASYLDDRLRGRSSSEACTVWGASGAATQDRSPILTKNRDYHLTHVPLQVLADAMPQEGYRYLYVTSAGSPAVFSSGINAAGLAVADTHVPSSDIGPGLARYSLMMSVLEQCATVEAAVSYLRDVRHMGAGNVVLADARGDLAVCESGYRRLGIIAPADGILVATNHFVSEELRDQYAGSLDAAAESRARYHTVVGALDRLRGEVSVARTDALMARHHDRSGAAICRHEGAGSLSTISNVIFLPVERRMRFRGGEPCRSAHATDLRLSA